MGTPKRRLKRAADRVGERHGRWTIIGAGTLTESMGRVFVCRCDCGRRRMVAATNLYTGKTTHCRACGMEEKKLRNDARAAAMVGAERGTLTFTGWARTRKGLRLLWRCECGRTGRTGNLKGPGPQCTSCLTRDRFRKRTQIRHRGVGYTMTELAEMIGVSRERVRQIYRDHGRAEVLRRAGLTGRR